MATAAAAKNDSVVRPPEGFRRASSVANAPWFRLKKGNLLRGILENMYRRNDERAPKAKDGSIGQSKFFQVKLVEACECRFGRGEDAKFAMAPAGTVVNLNYGPKTKDLESLIPSIMAGAEYEVWIHVQGEKFKISGSRTMWDVDVQSKIIKAAMVADDEIADLEGDAETGLGDGE